MVRVIQGATTLNAIPIYVSATRIDAIMPSNVPLGMVSIQAANGAVRGNMAPARVTDASFGISTANTIGIGPGQFMNLNDDGSTTQNTAASPAYIVSRLGGGHAHRPSCLVAHLGSSFISMISTNTNTVIRTIQTKKPTRVMTFLR